MWRRTLAAFLLAGAWCAADGASQTAPPPSQRDSLLDARTREIASLLRCPVCLNLSVQDTPSELGRDMRRLVRERLERGESKEQILQFFVDKYGEWILMEPKPHGVNLFVWLLPVVALLGGGALVLLSVRRWIRNSTASAPAPEPVAEEYLRKVQDELARKERD